MPMHACPDCAGSGVVHASTLTADGDDRTTWCRTCSGNGMVRIPDEDDEHEPIPLYWPESVFWKQRA